MFSSDSDEIVDVVERGVERIPDHGAAEPARPAACSRVAHRLISPRRADGILDEFDASVDRLLTERGRAPDAEPKDLLARLIAARDDRDRRRHDGARKCATRWSRSSWPATRPRRRRWPGPGICCRSIRRRKQSCMQELARVLGGRTPRNEDLANLPYTRMVIEEAMRLYPPAHTLGRAADRGRRSAAATASRPAPTVLIVPWMLHRKPSLWERAGPVRAGAVFARARSGAAALCLHAVRRRPAHLHRRAHSPWPKATLILATIAQRYRLRLKPGHPVEPQGLITIRPRYGLRDDPGAAARSDDAAVGRGRRGRRPGSCS